MTRAHPLQKHLDAHTGIATELATVKDEKSVQCSCCAHRCVIRNGKRGVCLIRYNENGQLHVPFGYVSGLQVDPIEKKPFYHVLSGHDALSFGMLGCNFKCSFCQNWITSQSLRDENAGSSIETITAEDIVRIAVKRNAYAVVSTYNEPLISSEWAYEIFTESKKHHKVNGYVSNGYATPEVLDYLGDVLDFMNVDLKCFDEKKYRQLGGSLKPVLDTITRLSEMGIFTEVVTLLVPGFNDNEDEIRQITDFISSVDPMIPWHVSAFHAQYKMLDHRSTTADDLLRAIDIGIQSGLKYIYAGNMAGRTGEFEDTRCHNCSATLVKRHAYIINDYRITSSGTCPDCGETIPGRWAEDGKPGKGAGTPYMP